MPTTFDAARINADLTLTNGKLTATHTGATAEDGIAPGTGFHSSGQWSFRIMLGNVTAAHTEIGMAASTTATLATNFLGQDTTSFGVQPGGSVIINQGNQGTASAYAASVAVDFAIDLTGKLLWTRSNGGNWNGNAAYSPGGLGGVSLSLLSTTNLSPAVDLYTQNDSATLNTTPYLGIPGFPNWDLPTGQITKTKDNYGVSIITTSGLVGAGNFTAPFLSEGYPYGSAHLVLTGGSATGDTVDLMGSNDGSTFYKVTTFTAGATNMLLPLAVSTAFDAPPRFYQFQIDSASTGSGTYTITSVLMGTRG